MEAFIFFPLTAALVAVIAQVIHDTVTIKRLQLDQVVKPDPVLEAKLDKALRTFDGPVWWWGAV
jgi:hypothetical protein